jgi:hypothetical protein
LQRFQTAATHIVAVCVTVFQTAAIWATNAQICNGLATAGKDAATVKNRC